MYQQETSKAWMTTPGLKFYWTNHFCTNKIPFRCRVLL